MSYRLLVFVAAGGSLALLLGAWGFQLAGYTPCQMCVWQRWPHAAAVAIGVLAYGAPVAAAALAGAGAAFVTAAIGVFHTGVERNWWEGVTACAAGGDGLSGLSGGDLLDTTREVGPALVRCDEVAWSFAGLSMASWNAVLSLALVAVWLLAARRARQADTLPRP